MVSFQTRCWTRNRKQLCLQIQKHNPKWLPIASQLKLTSNAFVCMALKGVDPNKSWLELLLTTLLLLLLLLICDGVLLRGIDAFGGGATEELMGYWSLDLWNFSFIFNLHNGGGLTWCPFSVPFTPFVWLTGLVNKCCPIVFGGSKPKKSFEILLPFPFDDDVVVDDELVSLSSARGSKSLSESEFSSKPSNFVPTLGFNASNVLLIWFCRFLGGTIGAKCFPDVSINNWSSLFGDETSIPKKIIIFSLRTFVSHHRSKVVLAYQDLGFYCH